MLKGFKEYFLYKWEQGFIVFLLHRITGLGLVLYLILHIYFISNLRDPEAFNAEMKLFAHPLFKLGELALLFAVLAHSLNGIRITLVDFTDAAYYHKVLFWIFAVIGAAFFAFGVWKMFPWGVFL